MKVLNIYESKSEIIEVDEGDWTTYRRYSDDVWEVLMSDSWEQFYRCDDVEKAYQEYIKIK